MQLDSVAPPGDDRTHVSYTWVSLMWEVPWRWWGVQAGWRRVRRTMSRPLRSCTPVHLVVWLPTTAASRGGCAQGLRQGSLKGTSLNLCSHERISDKGFHQGSIYLTTGFTFWSPVLLNVYWTSHLIYLTTGFTFWSPILLNVYWTSQLIPGNLFISSSVKWEWKHQCHRVTWNAHEIVPDNEMIHSWN